MVENMSSGTADALGLSRAILCNGMAKISFLIKLYFLFYSKEKSFNHIFFSIIEFKMKLKFLLKQ